MKIRLNDDERNEIIEYLQQGTVPNRLVGRYAKNSFKKRADKFIVETTVSNSVEEDIFKFKLGAGRTLRFFTSNEQGFKLDYIKLEHVMNGHAGGDRLHLLVDTRVYRVTRAEIQGVLNSSEVCQARSNLVTRPIIRPIISNYPRERYIADLIDLRLYNDINKGFKWILNVVDSFTKFSWTIPLKNNASSIVSNALETLFRTFGPCFILHTDNGREFVNQTIEELCRKYEIRHVRGRSRCPWIQGQVERCNQTIKWMIASTLITRGIMGQGNKVREEITWVYNNLRHATTRQTPII
ncbi:SCAN domain-containing protein 3 [Dictyocoela muelleri]|nr:SCAN domain-containing protein 3 [Dictyocoela muelleri]